MCRTSLFHSSNMPASPTTSAAMRAPCVGGLLQMARASRFSWLSTDVAACRQQQRTSCRSIAYQSKLLHNVAAVGV
jgi:hypothetical protein